MDNRHYRRMMEDSIENENISIEKADPNPKDPVLGPKPIQKPTNPDYEAKIKQYLKNKMGKSNYGPKAFGLYSQIDNARRKEGRTGESLNLGPNSEVRFAGPTRSKQAEAQAKIDKLKSKKNPVKVFSREERQDLARQKGVLAASEMAKGLHGDWKKEGYSFKVHNPKVEMFNGKHDITSHRVTAHDKDGNRVGDYHFSEWPEESVHKGLLHVTFSGTDPDHKRKGLATEAYKLIQEHTGKVLHSSNGNRSADAKALWNQPNRPFGKSIKSPSKHIPLDRLKQIKQDHSIGAGGQEYSEEEIDQEILGRKVSQADKMVRENLKRQKQEENKPDFKDLSPIPTFKKADKIPGGLSDNKKPSDFSKDKRKQGVKVEMEHTSDPKIAEEIAMDHLTEDINYYDKLKTIEKPKLKKALSPEEISKQGYRFKVVEGTGQTGKDGAAVIAFHGRKRIGHLAFTAYPTSSSSKDVEPGYHRVHNGHITEEHRGKGLYQHMLSVAKEHIKNKGSKGLMSPGYQRSKDATRAWDKVATHAMPFTPNATLGRKLSPEDSDYYLAASEEGKKVHYASPHNDRDFKRGETVRVSHTMITATKKFEIPDKKYTVHGQSKSGATAYWLVPEGEKDTRKGQYIKPHAMFRDEHLDKAELKKNEDDKNPGLFWQNKFSSHKFKTPQEAEKRIKGYVEHSNKQFGRALGMTDYHKEVAPHVHFPKYKNHYIIASKTKAPLNPRPKKEYQTSDDLASKQRNIYYNMYPDPSLRYSKVQNEDIKNLMPLESFNEEKVQKMISHIKNGGELPPILIEEDGAIADGHHRYEAAKRLKIKNVPVVKLIRMDKSELKKMSRPRLIFPNLEGISTRPDQEVQPITTEQQKKLFGRKVAAAQYRDAKDVPHTTMIQRPDGTLEVGPQTTKTVSQQALRDLEAKRVSNKFNTRQLGVLHPTKGGPKAAALAGKYRSKFEEPDDDYQQKLKEHTEKRNKLVTDYNQAYSDWRTKAWDLSREATADPTKALEYEDHMSRKPEKPKLPRKPSKKLKETTELSPEQMAQRGRSISSTVEHEGLHYTMNTIRQKYGPKAEATVKEKLLAAHDPEVLSHIASFISKRMGYKPKDKYFSEEVLAHSRDILVDPKKREHFKKFVGSDNADKVLQKLKAGHEKAYRVAQSILPKDIGVEESTPKKLAASEMEKGSRQKKIPFNPRKDTSEWQEEALSHWQHEHVGDSDESTPRDYRSSIGKDTGNIRDRFLHKLTANTKTRRSADGKREFLLHRGMVEPDKEFATAVTGNSLTDSHVSHSDSSSWTPKYDEAMDFAAHNPTRIISAWVHEDDVLTIPMQYGNIVHPDRASLNELGSIDYKANSGKNPYRQEFEVVVGPHKSQKAKDFKRPIKGLDPKDLNEKINIRGQQARINTRSSSHLQNVLKPKKLAASENAIRETIPSWKFPKKDKPTKKAGFVSIEAENPRFPEEENLPIQENLQKAPVEFSIGENITKQPINPAEKRAAHRTIASKTLPNGLIYKQTKTMADTVVHQLWHPDFDQPVAEVKTRPVGHPDPEETQDHMVSWSQVHGDHTGKGLGRQLYNAVLLHGKGVGRLLSDYALSQTANKAWEKLSKQPGIQGKLAPYATQAQGIREPQKYDIASDTQHMVQISNKKALDLNSMFPKVELGPKKLAASEEMKKAPIVNDIDPKDDHWSFAHSVSHFMGTSKRKPLKFTSPTENGMFHHKIIDNNETSHVISRDEKGEDPVAHMIVIHQPSNENKLAGQVVESVVDKDHRGKGVGKQLYMEALKHHGKLESDTSVSPEAHKLYQKLSNHPNIQADLAPYGSKYKTSDKAGGKKTVLDPHSLTYTQKPKKLAASELNKNEAADKESEVIKENKKKPEAKTRHKFKAAKWTHPNGHPRCIVCGDEERIGGFCEGQNE